MEELEALKEIQHNLCEMAEWHFTHASEDSSDILLETDSRLACENVQWAYQLGKIIDKMEAEI